MSPTKLWSEAVGFLPHKVTCYEHADKRLAEGQCVLYLRWRAAGNWRKRSLGVALRDAKGKAQAHVKRMALAEAERQYEILSGRRASPSGPSAPLTIGTTWTLISEKDGLYPTLTPHAKEVSRALAVAARIWGAALPWDVIDRSRIRMLGRTRIDELRRAGRVGYRAAELTVQRVLSVAAWLRDESKIASDACLAPRRWREDLRTYWSQVSGEPAPEASRPRHTLEEMRQLLTVAPQVDARFALLMALGAELRLGQVARARRSDIDETHRTLTIRGRGRKKGTIVELTNGQWATWLVAKAGYLAQLEAAAIDYPLFPMGQMPGGRKEKGKGVATVERHANAAPIERTAVRKWFREAETLAKIPHVSGRGAYGLRRVAVDAAKELHISREALKVFGGWSDTQVPDMVYADQDAQHARTEAADIRARMRGES